MIGFDFKIFDKNRFIRRASFEKEAFESVKYYKKDLQKKLIETINWHIGHRLESHADASLRGTGIGSGALLKSFKRNKVFTVRKIKIADNNPNRGKVVTSISVGLNKTAAGKKNRDKLTSLSRGMKASIVHHKVIASWIRSKIKVGKWTGEGRASIVGGFVKDLGIPHAIAKNLKKKGYAAKIKGIDSVHKNSVNYMRMKDDLDKIQKEYTRKIVRMLTLKIKARNNK